MEKEGKVVTGVKAEVERAECWFVTWNPEVTTPAMTTTPHAEIRLDMQMKNAGRVWRKVGRSI